MSDNVVPTATKDESEQLAKETMQQTDRLKLIGTVIKKQLLNINGLEQAIFVSKIIKTIKLVRKRQLFPFMVRHSLTLSMFVVRHVICGSRSERTRFDRLCNELRQLEQRAAVHCGTRLARH
jgi:hypothetical protein